MTPLPSHEPWYQSTYGVVSTSDWNLGSQGADIMDNGDVIIWTGRYADRIRQGGEQYFRMLGKVRPGGVEQLTGDARALNHSVLGTPYALFPSFLTTPYEWPWSATGYDVGGKISETFFSFGEQEQFHSDGKNLWAYIAGSARMYKFDLEANTWEWVAGVHRYVAQDSYYTDSSIGANATFDGANFGQPGAIHDGYLYFTGYGPSGAGWPWLRNDFLSVRRMKLTPPYPVETPWPWQGRPAGFTTPGTEAAHYANATKTVQINPATGLPHGFNSDVFAGSFGIKAMAVHDGFLYYAHEFLVVPWVQTTINSDPEVLRRLNAISRMSLTTGLTEPVYYGFSSGKTKGLMRDHASNAADFPNGLTFFDLNGTGTSVSEVRFGSERMAPTLEGFQPHRDMVVLADGTLVFVNIANTLRQGGTLVNDIICTLDLSDWDGVPRRHSRENPGYRTIAGGTFADEQYSGFTFQSNNRKRWFTQDGSRPLLAMVQQHSLATNNVHPDWQNKVVYSTLAIPDSIYEKYQDVGPEFVKVLQRPSTTTTFKVRVNFEGTALKGYAPVHGLTRSGPTEAILG